MITHKKDEDNISLVKNISTNQLRIMYGQLIVCKWQMESAGDANYQEPSLKLHGCFKSNFRRALGCCR